MTRQSRIWVLLGSTFLLLLTNGTTGVSSLQDQTGMGAEREALIGPNQEEDTNPPPLPVRSSPRRADAKGVEGSEGQQGQGLSMVDFYKGERRKEREGKGDYGSDSHSTGHPSVRKHLNSHSAWVKVTFWRNLKSFHRVRRNKFFIFLSLFRCRLP